MVAVDCSALVHARLRARDPGGCVHRGGIVCYKIPSLVFPWVLRQFDVVPFDFCKVIDSFVRYEPAV